MPEVGVEGQRSSRRQGAVHRRRRARLAGGMYLAAAGVGTIGIVDFDVVDFSNLQRQIIHGTPDVGRSKLAVGEGSARRAQPERHIETYETALTSENALEHVRALRRHPRRHRQLPDALSRQRRVRAARQAERLRQHLPLRRAGVGLRHEGRPVLPLPLSRAAAAGLVPSCAEGGVLGVLPGIIGVIQATETIKLILGIGEPLIGRFLIYDALRMRFRELKLRKDPGLPGVRHASDRDRADRLRAVLRRGAAPGAAVAVVTTTADALTRAS